eukprot:366259-Chlamydomonas_euryale.AAC.14
MGPTLVLVPHLHTCRDKDVVCKHVELLLLVPAGIGLAVRTQAARHWRGRHLCAAMTARGKTKEGGGEGEDALYCVWPRACTMHKKDMECLKRCDAKRGTTQSFKR